MNNIDIVNPSSEEIPLYLLDDNELKNLRLTTLNIFYRQISVNGNLSDPNLVSMHSDVLQAIDHGYTKSIAFLIKHGGLFTNNHYIVGQHAIAYSLYPHAVQQIFGSLSAKDIKKLSDIRYKRYLAFYRNHPEYDKYKKVSGAARKYRIDPEGNVVPTDNNAIIHRLDNPEVNAICFQNANELHLRFQSDIVKLESQGTVDAYTKLIASMQLYNVSVDGRIYSNATNMPKNYIPAGSPEKTVGTNFQIKYLNAPSEGDKIYVIDKNCAHPTFLAHILREDYSEDSNPTSRAQANLLINKIDNGMDFYSAISPNDRSAGKKAVMLFLNDTTRTNNLMYVYLQENYPAFLSAALGLKQKNNGMLWKILAAEEHKIIRSADKGISAEFIRLSRIKQQKSQNHKITILDYHDGIIVTDGIEAANAIENMSAVSGYNPNNFTVDVYDFQTKRMEIKKMKADRLFDYAKNNIEETKIQSKSSTWKKKIQDAEDILNTNMIDSYDYDMEVENNLFQDSYDSNINQANNPNINNRTITKKKNIPTNDKKIIPTYNQSYIKDAVRRLIQSNNKKDQPKVTIHIDSNTNRNNKSSTPLCQSSNMQVFDGSYKPTSTHMHLHAPTFGVLTTTQPTIPLESDAIPIESDAKSIQESLPGETSVANLPRPAQFRGRDTPLTAILLEKRKLV